jgi:hypothetical protein
MALILALACVFQPILAFVALAFMALLFLQKVGNRRIGASAVRARRPAFFAIYGFAG